MASPNSTFTEIVSTTLRNRSAALADNVSNGNALLMRLNKRGKRKAATGRTIVQELEYAEGTFSWYSGYEVIDISVNQTITAAEFNWKQCAAAVSASGLEVEVQNAGKEAVINLLSARISNAERTMKNQMTSGLYSDGTGNGGKEIGGLQLLVADAPTASSSPGGINQSTNTFWRNQAFDATTDGGAAASSSNIQSYMNTVWLNTVRGSDTPDLIVADNNYYGFYLASLQSIQRVTAPEMAEAGFTSLKYMDADVVFEDSAIPTNHMYFLNSDFLHYRFSPARNMTPLDQVQSINQDAITQLITWAGNLTVSNRSVQGVLKD